MTYNSRVGNYTYGTKPHAVTQAGADAYAYDANGNMTGGAGRTFTYDYDNRATSVVKAGAATISVYDASGQRVKKAVPGATTIYIGKLYECTNSVCTKYIFGGSDRIASIEGTNTRYYHTDHLGSSSVITDQNGVSVQSIYYYPYGETHTVTGTDIARHKFTGQEYDAETGLYYYNARYYDPKLARFITADVIVPEAFNPQALNRYSYVYDNPLKYTDPTGHWGWAEIITVIIVAAVIYYDTCCDDKDRLNVNASGGVSTDGAGNTTLYNPSGGSGGGGSGGANPGSVTGVAGLGGEAYRYSSGSSEDPFVITSFKKRYLELEAADYDRYEVNERESINREMLPANSKRETDGKSGNITTHKEVEWIDVTLGGVSGGAALVALGAPHPAVKFGAAFVGTVSTLGSVGYSVYQYNEGRMSRNELAVQIALDVTPMFGKAIAGKTAAVAFDVLEHQIGLGQGLKSIFYDPNRKE